MMLAEVIWQSALLVSAGLMAGLMIGFVMYPLLFVRPVGVHRKGGVATSGDPAPARIRPAAPSPAKAPP